MRVNYLINYLGHLMRVFPFVFLVFSLFVLFLEFGRDDVFDVCSGRPSRDSCTTGEERLESQRKSLQCLKLDNTKFS